jgi:hypothetical protein
MGAVAIDPAELRGHEPPVRKGEHNEWLFREVTLRFAAIELRFRAADPGFLFRLADSHVPFLADPVATGATCEIVCSRGEPVPANAPIAYTSDIWDLRHLPDGGEEILFHYGQGVRHPGWRLRFESSFRTGESVEKHFAHRRSFREAEPGEPDDKLLHIAASQFVEYIVARIAPRVGVLHIHSSMALVNDGAYVFVGHSGAGKSTIAALAEQAGAFIPADDRVLIARGTDGAEAWGTPWHGALPRKSPRGGRLKAIYLLQQDARDYVEPIGAARAVKELYVRLIQPGLSPGEIALNLEALERLVETVPVEVLHFRPSPEAFSLAVATHP